MMNLNFMPSRQLALYAAKLDGRNRISVAPPWVSREAPLVAAL